MLQLADLRIQRLELLLQLRDQCAHGVGQGAALVSGNDARLSQHHAQTCAMTMPNSLSRPRIWLAKAVRAFTKPWRARCTASKACCSGVLTATKRMLACTSARSLLLDLT